MSGVTLYRPDRFGSDDLFGYEIDNLLHWQSEADDRLVIFECKDSPIRVATTSQGISPENQEWYAPSPSGIPRNLKDQLFNQAESIWQNLCIYPSPRRRIDAFIVTSAPTLRLKCTLYSLAGLTLHLVNEMDLLELFREPSRLADVLDTALGGRFLRIAQSDLLRMARQSVVVSELGHPEIDHSIEMIRRCRRTLDGRLFDFFKPRDRRWAINGSAGMGKSVLLAYTAAVFSTGRSLREIPRSRNDRVPIQTELVEQLHAELSLPPLQNRRILVVGLKPRQLEVLRELWNQFFLQFKRLAGNYLPAAQPLFSRWTSSLDLSGFNIMCIDEAHDLAASDQARIAAWWAEKPGERYLVIACDRHQRLRFSAAEQEQWMIKGVSFSGCSTRLSRNYRSPTSVYCAGLALMFRWFAPSGAKVVPEKSHLEQSFGFQVRLIDRRREGRVALTLINDAHPANHWRFTVSRFTHTDTALAWLDANRLRQEDVLWVRFSEEFPDAENDSEHIKVRFNYKGLDSFNPHTTIDSEIKGRDFPVVVIEGLPSGMGSLNITDAVWGLRRQVYLCASRATAFLFFIFKDNNSSQEATALNQELEAMLKALASPEDPTAASTKKWSFEFSLPETPVGMDVFSDDVVPDPRFPVVAEEPPAVAQPMPVLAVEAPASPAKQAAQNVPEFPASTAIAVSTTKPPLVRDRAKEDIAPLVSAPNDDPITPPPEQPSPPQAAPLTTGAPVPTSTSTPGHASTPRMAEKDFQRRWGHIRDWKKTLYAQHLETGKLPTVKSQLRADNPPRQPPPSVPKPVLAPYLTVEQLARHLEVKTFKLIAAIRQRRPGFVTPDETVLPGDMAALCLMFNRPPPTESQRQLLSANRRP